MDIQQFYRQPVSELNCEEDFIYQPIEWHDSNTLPNTSTDEDDSEGDEEKPREYTIYSFGVDQNKQSVCVIIKDFTPFFYVKVKESFTKEQLKSFIDFFREKLYIKEDDNFIKVGKYIVEEKCVVIKRKDFFGFTNDRLFKFVRLVFSDSSAQRRAINLINGHNSGGRKYPELNKYGKLSIYEANIDNTIKFIHINNNTFSGWTQIGGGKYTFIDPVERISNCQVEIECKWTDIKPYVTEEPIPNAKFLQASYDIETYSKSGAMPTPDIKENVIFQIATVFKFFGEKEMFLKTIFVLGACDPIEEPDTLFIKCKSEKQLIKTWLKLIEKVDPDIIYHYNGDQFDGQYIYERAKLLGINVFSGKLKEVETELKLKTFESSAYGKGIFKRLQFVGRLNFDVMTYIHREYKLAYYKLDFVAEHFLKENKHPITANMMFKAYKEQDPVMLHKTALYCVQDTMLPLKLSEHLLILLNQISMSNITYVPIRYLLERGQTVKVMSQVYKETRKNNYVIPTQSYEDRDTDTFEGATVLEPKRGYYEVPVTVCDFASLYPSIIRADNLCYSTIVLDKKEMEGHPEEDFFTKEWDEEQEVKVETEPEGPGKKRPKKETKVVKKHYSFTYYTKKQGLLPQILAELADERKRYKNLMKNAPNKDLYNIYNQCQLAVKVSMNSVYGFLAAPLLCCKPMAATVTAIGREMIKSTCDFMLKHYPCEIIYGDTDSVFVIFYTKSTELYKEAIKNKESKEVRDKLKKQCITESIEIGKVAAKAATKELFKWPKSLEYEKVGCPLFLLNKKRYILHLYEESAEKYKEVNKGLILTRRDSTILEKEIFKTVCDLLFAGATKEEVVDYIRDTLSAIINNGIPFEKFISCKTLKDGYKNGNLPHVIVTQKMKERGDSTFYNINDRVPFVFVEKKPKMTKKGTVASSQPPSYSQADHPEYVKREGLDLDIRIYLEKIKNIMEDILSIFFDDPKALFKEYLMEYVNNKW